MARAFIITVHKKIAFEVLYTVMHFVFTLVFNPLPLGSNIPTEAIDISTDIYIRNGSISLMMIFQLHPYYNWPYWSNDILHITQSYLYTIDW